MKFKYLNNNRLRRHWPKFHFVNILANHTGERITRIGVFGHVFIIKWGGILNI